jgi:hypothetical protein
MKGMNFFLILITLGMPLLTHAAEVQLTSSTQSLFYQDILAADKTKTINEAVESLRLNITNLDKEGKLNIYAYGRANQQLWSSSDLEGRLYYFYLDYRDAFNEHLDVRAGRTFVNAAAISGTIDGLYVNLKNLGPLGFTAFGGRNVIFENNLETSTLNDALIGMSVYLDTIKNTHVEVSYGKKYSGVEGDAEVVRENVGLDFSTTPIDGMVNFYTQVKYDIISESYNALLFGLKINPIEDLILRGEYYDSYPTFDTKSIYRVFAVTHYNEVGVSAEYQLTNNYRVSVKYTREDFTGDATANVYRVGFLARPIKNLTINASYEKRDGYAGELGGIQLYGEYRIDKAKIMAGIDYDDFRRQTDPADPGEENRQGTARKEWVGLGYQFTKTISVVVRLENNVNFNYDNTYQGYVAINIKY